MTTFMIYLALGLAYVAGYCTAKAFECAPRNTRDPLTAEQRQNATIRLNRMRVVSDQRRRN